MSDEDYILDHEVGVQNDGEAVAVEDAPVEETAAPEAEAEPTQEETPEQEEHRKKTGSQRAKEKAQRLAEENEMLRRLLTQQQKPAEQESPKAPQADGKPLQENYETHAEWVEAVTDWKVDQRLREREAKVEAEKRQTTWQTKAEAARAKYQDFDDALESAPAPSRPVAEVLAESPVGAELAYHLANHPDDYQRINRMSPVAAARELGLLEARLATPKSAAAPVAAASRAPKPPSPVSAAPAAKPTDDGRIVVY